MLIIVRESRINNNSSWETNIKTCNSARRQFVLGVVKREDEIEETCYIQCRFLWNNNKSDDDEIVAVSKTIANNYLFIYLLTKL